MKIKTLAGAMAILSSSVAFSQEKPKTIDLNEVLVTASRMQLPLKSIPQKVEVIDQAQIQANPSENLGEILKRSTSLDIIQYPGALVTVGMRGFPATAHSRSYTLLLIDGKPAGSNNLATIPADFIERIEVVKGPYSVLYGSDAMGGVINVITKAPTAKASGKVGVSVGNFGQTNLMGDVSASINNKLRFAFGFSRKQQNKDYRIGSNNLLHISETGEHILDKKSYGDQMTNTQFEINQFNGKLQYQIDDKWSASWFSTLTLSNDIETPGNYWHSNGMSKKDIDRISNYVDVTRTTANNQLTISPYYTSQNESNYDNNTDSAFIKSKEKIKQYGVKVGNSHTWGDFRWLVGADFEGYKVASEKFSKKTVPTTPLRPDHHRNAVSAFTQLAYTYNNLFVNAGLRYNFIRYTLEANEMLKSDKKSTNYSNVNPSLGLTYKFTKELSAHASVGNAFYVPDAYKTAGLYKVGKKIYVGNPDLKPETSTSYDLGLRYEYKDYISVDATYFQNFYKHKIVNDNSRKDTTSYKNAQDGMMNGVELMLSSNIASFWTTNYKINLYGGITYYFNNEFKDKGKDADGKEITVTKEMLYIRKASGNFGVAFDNNNGFVARLNARYIGKRLENDWMGDLRPDIKPENYYAKDGYTAADKILQHPAHMVFDLSSSYMINSHFKVGFSISNLFDENYTEKDGYNMPGRSFMGHVSYQF